MEEHCRESESARRKIEKALEASISASIGSDLGDPRGYFVAAGVIAALCYAAHWKCPEYRCCLSYLASLCGLLLLYVMEWGRKCRPVGQKVRQAVEESGAAFSGLWTQPEDLSSLHRALDEAHALLAEAYRMQEPSLRGASYADLLCRTARAESALEIAQRHTLGLQRHFTDAIEGLRSDVLTHSKSAEAKLGTVTKAVEELAQHPRVTVNNNQRYYDNRSVRYDNRSHSDSRSYLSNHYDNRSYSDSRSYLTNSYTDGRSYSFSTSSMLGLFAADHARTPTPSITGS